MKAKKLPSQNTRSEHPDGYSYGWFYDPVYEANIHFIWDAEQGTLTKYTKEIFNTDVDEGRVAFGRCVRIEHSDGRQSIIIAISKSQGVAFFQALAHECLHATFYILINAGMKLSDDSDEAYCYLHDSIVKRCLDMMKQPTRRTANRPTVRRPGRKPQTRRR